MNVLLCKISHEVMYDFRMYSDLFITFSFSKKIVIYDMRFLKIFFKYVLLPCKRKFSY